MTSTPDESFRKLFKNDVCQTTDQWRERTLQRLGEVSGQWTAWVEKDTIPVSPGPRPRPPVKPNTDTVMALLKEQERQSIFNQRQLTESTLTIDNVPAPNDLEIWTLYEGMNATYREQLRVYEYQDKLAREVFPEENRKVFPSLIKCISTASVQDLKRFTLGEAYFNAHDAYNFFKLAIQEHAHVPATISAAAVTRAKEQLEGLRQKSEDTITEHVNEFRRLHEVLIQAKGPGSTDPYADYELRDLLIRSLYPPLWTPWVDNREDTDTMPVTFEDLVTALKKAETKKILRSPSPIDTHMPSAHVTRTVKKGDTSPRSDRKSDTSPRSPSTVPSTCHNCGKPFCPNRPSHVRCDTCQLDYSQKNKKDRTPASRKPSSASRRSPPKAHATLVYESDPDEPPSDADEQPPKGSSNFTSFSCICSSRGSTSHDNVIYLDNCSNLNIIRDKTIALHLRQDPLATNITGSIPGTLSSKLSAEVGDLGRGCYDPNFSRNLISEDSVLQAGYRITRDSSTDSNYYLHKEGRPPLI